MKRLLPPVKRSLKVLAVLVLTGGILAAWLASVDRDALGQALREARPEWVAVVALLSLAHLAIRAARWKVLLGGTAARWWPLLRWTGMGYAVTFVLPGRAGEVVRPVLAWSRGRVPAGLAFGSVVIERVLDVMTLVVLLAGWVALSPEAPPALARTAWILLAAVVSAGIMGLSVLHARRRWLESVARWSARRAPARFRARAEDLAASLVASLEPLAAKGAWWRIPGWSLATWLPVMAALLAALEATRIEVAPSAALLLAPLTALGIAVPTPAGIGGYHWAMTYGLELLGVPSGPAAAAAVACHGASVLSVLLFGLGACWVEGLSPGALREQAASRRDAARDTIPSRAIEGSELARDE